MSPRKRTDESELFRVAWFILFDALVFHEVLSSSIRVRSMRKVSGSFQRFLDHEWERILEINFEPVFALARELLNALPTSPTTEKVLRELAETALDAVGSGILLRHDFMGRIYHRLLLRTTGHYYATYYTSIPAARLLTQLVFKTSNPSWSFQHDGRWALEESTQLSDFRVLDPACGSGTLLSAAYTTLKDIHILSRPTGLDLKRFHRICVERVIHGWDVLDYAGHLTLTTLALHEYRAAFKDANIYTVSAGVGPGGRVHLGSLDYLSPQRSLLGKGFSAPTVKKGLAKSREKAIPLEETDVVLMNPPFSRSANPNVKFGYAPERDRLRMSRRLQELSRELGVEGIGQAGLGAFFVLLADMLVKHQGRMGLVLPRSCLSGVSWEKIREKLAGSCHLEYVVSNFDPGDPSEGVEPWNWSENTDLGEVLLVARKVGKEANGGATTYVNFWHKPRNDVESLLLSQQVLKFQAEENRDLPGGYWQYLHQGKDEIGTCFRVPQKSLGVNWLFPCLFAYPDLDKLTYEWVVRPPCEMVRLGNLVKRFGPDIKQVKDHFSRSGARTAYPMVWGHQGAMDRIGLDDSFVGYGNTKMGKRSEDLHSMYAAKLLIAERPHLHTECLLAAEVTQPVLATAFWEIQLERVDDLPLVLLWLQSTFGFILFLAYATSSMGDIFKLKKAQLARVPVVSPKAVAGKECEKLYQEIRSVPFRRFPDEFAAASRGEGARKKIDDFFISQLGIGLDLHPYYELFAREPVICTRRL